MSLPRPIPEDLAVLIAKRFRAISEPTRIRLLDCLRDGEQTVNQLAAAIATGQQNASKHLAVLTDAGIVGRRREGNYAYYRITDQSVLAICEEVCGAIEEQATALAALLAGDRRP
jgi:DNA-binding transcriptional ArsR family regulator